MWSEYCFIHGIPLYASFFTMEWKVFLSLMVEHLIGVVQINLCKSTWSQLETNKHISWIMYALIIWIDPDFHVSVRKRSTFNGKLLERNQGSNPTLCLIMHFCKSCLSFWSISISAHFDLLLLFIGKLTKITPEVFVNYRLSIHVWDITNYPLAYYILSNVMMQPLGNLTEYVWHHQS